MDGTPGPQEGPAPRSRLPNALRALRSANYRLFISGQLISMVGTWVQSVAQSWLVYRLTGSSALLGLVAFTAQIPILLLAPVGGALADRHDRVRILLATQALAASLATTIGLLAVGERVTLGALFTISSLLGVVSAFDVPARQALVAQLVPRRDLQNAIAINSSVFSAARMLGPAVGGLLVAGVGEGWCFLINALSYLPVIINLTRLRLPPSARARPAQAPFAAVREGLAYVARNRPIRALLLHIGMASIAGMPYLVLMPVFAAEVLHGTAHTLGILMGCSGIGAVAAGVLLSGRSGLAGLGRLIAIAGCGFGASTVLFAVSRWELLSGALLVAAGFFMVLLMSATNTLLQALAPEALRGRVMSAYTMVLMGFAPLGALAVGVIAHPIGAPAAVVIGGSLCTCSGLLFMWKLPGLREEARVMMGKERKEGEEQAGAGESLGSG